MIPSVSSVDGASVDITTYTCTGDLHGLIFDKTTGMISGTPTTPGVSDVNVTAEVGTTTLETQAHISITDSKEFKNKYVYIGAGGAAIATGARNRLLLWVGLVTIRAECTCLVISQKC